MGINSNSSIKSLCGLQEIYTDFDAWLCVYRAYFSPRGSHYPKSYDDLTENQTQDKNKINYNGVSITLQHLIVEGFIANNINNTKINDYHNFLKFIQNGDDYLTYINGGKNYMRSKLLFSFIIIHTFVTTLQPQYRHLKNNPSKIEGLAFFYLNLYKKLQQFL